MHLITDIKVEEHPNADYCYAHNRYEMPVNISTPRGNQPISSSGICLIIGQKFISKGRESCVGVAPWVEVTNGLPLSTMTHEHGKLKRLENRIFVLEQLLARERDNWSRWGEGQLPGEITLVE